MKSFIIVSFLFAAIFSFLGVSQASEECLMAANVKCKIHSNITKLRKPEEMVPLCKYSSCLLEEIVACRSDSSMIPTLDRVSNYFKDLCDSTTHFNKAVVDNVECMAAALEDEICFKANASAETVSKASEDIKKLGISEISSQEEDKSECINSLYKHACENQKIAHCGADALYALGENYKSLWYPYDVCNAEVINHLPEVIELLSKTVSQVLEESEKDKQTADS